MNKLTPLVPGLTSSSQAGTKWKMFGGTGAVSSRDESLDLLDVPGVVGLFDGLGLGRARQAISARHPRRCLFVAFDVERLGHHRDQIEEYAEGLAQKIIALATQVNGGCVALPPISSVRPRRPTQLL
ncbi:hypothetical protein DIJ64_03260 [Mycobacterium leprae]|uniref:Uncharacterized protein n=2 Tax=Mycobacterium leprae TaxID=1769 RepID=Q49694_MYCLR|nr:hypothetical protein DIJ64_03260 [Mycobacterium leprae]CAB16164.1 hypothetical protein MLCL536.21c [Mycobacterium leprae]